jgi:uncharacterized membrane protein YebE (DUF533 family)
MDTRGLLDQLLGAGKNLLSETGMTGADGKISDLGKGAAAGGLAGLLLGSKGGRKVAAYGGLAALGVMAYRAYANRSDAPTEAAAQQPSLEHSGKESRLVLKALLAGARADGHIDDRERALIDQEIERLGGDPEVRGWVERELSSPLDPQAVAAEVGGDPILASEVYLATALVIADAGFMERAYLDQLAVSLGLDDALKARLEREVQAA